MVELIRMGAKFEIIDNHIHGVSHCLHFMVHLDGSKVEPHKVFLYAVWCFVDESPYCNESTGLISLVRFLLGIFGYDVTCCLLKFLNPMFLH